MPLLNPLALLGLLFIPAVIAMYMLKLRRDEAVVPSTLLWTRLLTDVEANAPWQRLRRSLLLLLQLLLVLILVLLAARPFLERPAGLARDIILVVDTSASMGATDVLPNRLEGAKSAAIEALKELPTGGVVSVIAAERTARIVANETSDLGRVRQAINDLRPTSTTGDLGDALELASKLARRSGDAEILVATDGALATTPTTEVDAPIHVLPVGRDRNNQAIAALAVRTDPSALTQSAFIGVANLDLESAERRLEVYGDGVLIEAQDLTLDPQTRQDIVIDDITNGRERTINVLEVRLTSGDPDATGDPDQLALDDRAWAIVPPTRERVILVVGEGDPYLEDRALEAAERRPVARARRPTTRGTRTTPRASRGTSSIFEGTVSVGAARRPDPRHRAGPLEPARCGQRNPDQPGHRLTQPGRADPQLRRPVHAPRGRGGADDPPRLGAGRHPGTPRRPAPVCRRARWPADRGPRLRSPPVGPAAAGGVPDPAGEPDRRAARRIVDTGRSDPARRPGRADDPARNCRPAHHGSRRSGPGARPGHRRQHVGHVQRHRAARRLHGHPDPRSGRVTGAVRLHASADGPSRELAFGVRRSGGGRGR